MHIQKLFKEGLWKGLCVCMCMSEGKGKYKMGPEVSCDRHW